MLFVDGPVFTLMFICSLPNVAVTGKPVKRTLPAIPQALSFQLSLPQPVLISPTVVSSPKDVVKAIPVTEL